MTRQELFSMEFGEVSIVDDPMNEAARVVIVKARSGQSAEDEDMAEDADEQENDDMDAAQVEAALKEAATAVEEVTKALKIEKARGDAAEAKVTALEAEVAKAKAAANPAAAEEEILKGVPESFRKRLFEAEAELATTRAANEESEAISKARALGAADDEAKVLGPLLARVRKGKTTADDADKLEQVIKSAKAAAGAGGLFARLGQTVAPEITDADAFFKAKAAEIRKSKPQLTEAQAYAEAMAANPQVYAKSVRAA